MDLLEYKGFQGTAELDMSRCVCRGKVLFIADVVTFESATPEGLRLEFEAAVDDYLETCEALGREPKKPASGTFNVRTSPELHRQAQIRAYVDGTSMNDVVARALSSYLSPKREVHERHTEKHFVLLRQGDQGTLRVAMSGNETCEVARVLQ